YQLHTTFNAKPGKGVGGFDGSANPFRGLLVDYVAQSIEFHEFSVASGKRLLETIVAENMVEAGFVIFSEYEYLATKYLLITLLDTKDHVEVNQYLEISQSNHLDLSKMQIAVRINITEYQINPESNRYISFLKGRMGRRVSDFFMQFIGCDEKIDVKQQNKLLVQQVDEYLSSETLDKEEKHQSRDALVDYYKQKVDIGEDIQLEELDDVLSNASGGSQRFSAYTTTTSTALEPSFAPDKTMLSAMKKYSGSGGGVSLNFDRKLLGERVFADFDNDTLTIKGIPPNLKDQLLKSLHQDQE
ncbi:MAG: nucleoid-associated protein, partial [Pseudomonadota bacterium]